MRCPKRVVFVAQCVLRGSAEILVLLVAVSASGYSLRCGGGFNILARACETHLDPFSFKRVQEWMRWRDVVIFGRERWNVVIIFSQVRLD